MFYKQHAVATWSEAVIGCRAEGAQLATPTSPEHAQEILKQTSNDTKYIWVGMHDKFTEGTFVTLTGEAPSYSNWNAGELQDDGSLEDCVVMSTDGALLYDVPCEERYVHVCAVPQSEVTHNSLCETYDSDYVYNIDADRCYKLHAVPKSWHEAFQTCRAEDSQLVIINSEEEASLLKDMVTEDGALVYIGVSALLVPGTFLTLDGKSLQEAGYSSWDSGQPDLSGTGEKLCGTLHGSGRLRAESCNSKLRFFCEKTLKSAEAGPVIDTRFGKRKIGVAA